MSVESEMAMDVFVMSGKALAAWGLLGDGLEATFERAGLDVEPGAEPSQSQARSVQGVLAATANLVHASWPAIHTFTSSRTAVESFADLCRAVLANDDNLVTDVLRRFDELTNDDIPEATQRLRQLPE